MPQTGAFESELRERATDMCELCRAAGELGIRPVPPAADSAARCILVCETCISQIEGTAELDDKHWFCLREAVWSEVPVVQVQSYRLLRRLEGSAWADDLLTQIYLSDEVKAWADAIDNAKAQGVKTLDSNGTELFDGDAVTLIKDLEVKGAGFTAKRGTLVKNIRLIDDPDNIEGRVNKITIVLKTQFLKRA